MAKEPFQLRAKFLRERAKRCFRLASEASRPEDTDLLNEIGREYLEAAEKLEAAMKRALKRRPPKKNRSK